MNSPITVTSHDRNALLQAQVKSPRDSLPPTAVTIGMVCFSVDFYLPFHVRKIIETELENRQLLLLYQISNCAYKLTNREWI